MGQNREFKRLKFQGILVLFVLVLISGCYTPPKDLVLVNKAGELSIEGKYDECISTCNEALAINPSNYWAYGYRGSCYCSKGNFDQAIADYRRALEISPGDQASIIGLKTALFLQSREARAQYDPSLKTRPKDLGKAAKSDSGVRPDIQLHKVIITPKRITPGSHFDLIFEFSVWDPSTEKSSISVIYSYSILEGQKVIFKSKQRQIAAPNGKNIQRVAHLTAAAKKGTYKIEVELAYKNIMAGQRVAFEIL
jgi:tetratricopeptide (TPR) repeat protein